MSVFSGPVTITINPHEEDEASPSCSIKYEGQRVWMPRAMAVRVARAILEADAVFSQEMPPALAMPDPPEGAGG